MINMRSRKRKTKGTATLSTHPLSRILSSCLLVSLRGSPLPSTATASSSSKLGATNMSRRWNCCCFLPVLARLSTAASAATGSGQLAAPLDWRPGGRTIGKVFQW